MCVPGRDVEPPSFFAVVEAVKFHPDDFVPGACGLSLADCNQAVLWDWHSKIVFFFSGNSAIKFIRASLSLNTLVRRPKPKLLMDFIPPLPHYEQESCLMSFLQF